MLLSNKSILIISIKSSLIECITIAIEDIITDSINPKIAQLSMFLYLAIIIGVKNPKGINKIKFIIKFSIIYLIVNDVLYKKKLTIGKCRVLCFINGKNFVDIKVIK
ncbi:protein of unknown function [Clostridium beijerinckii]|nr:protein of unknown function [Clostridium beijerinckii]